MIRGRSSSDRFITQNTVLLSTRPHSNSEHQQCNCGNEGPAKNEIATPGNCPVRHDYKKERPRSVQQKQEMKFDVRFVISHDKCLMPFRPWNAKGAARMVFPASLTYSGKPWTASMTAAESKGIPTTGPAKYAREKP